MICGRGSASCPATVGLPPIARSGSDGYLATRILLQKGFSVANIGGGYMTYKLFQPVGS